MKPIKLSSIQEQHLSNFLFQPEGLPENLIDRLGVNQAKIITRHYDRITENPAFKLIHEERNHPKGRYYDSDAKNLLLAIQGKPCELDHPLNTCFLLFEHNLEQGANNTRLKRFNEWLEENNLYSSSKMIKENLITLSRDYGKIISVNFQKDLDSIYTTPSEISKKQPINTSSFNHFNAFYLGEPTPFEENHPILKPEWDNILYHATQNNITLNSDFDLSQKTNITWEDVFEPYGIAQSTPNFTDLLQKIGYNGDILYNLNFHPYNKRNHPIEPSINITEQINPHTYQTQEPVFKKPYIQIEATPTETSISITNRIINATGNLENNNWHPISQIEWDQILSTATKNLIDLNCNYNITPNTPLTWEAVFDPIGGIDINTIGFTEMLQELGYKGVKTDDLALFYGPNHIIDQETIKRLLEIEALEPKTSPNRKSLLPLEEYQYHAKEMTSGNINNFNDTTDNDIAKAMFMQNYKKNDIERAINAASPLVSLKKDKTYAKTIVGQVAQQPEIKKYIKKNSIER